jgi:hypothetical protein
MPARGLSRWIFPGPAHLKKFLQKLPAWAFQNSGRMGKGMVKSGVRGKIASTSAQASHFAIGNGKNDPTHAGHHAGSAAHGTGFLCYVKGAIVEPPVAKNRRSPAYGDEFAVSQNATAPGHIVASCGKEVIFPDNNRSNGDLVRIKCIPSGIVGQFHPVFVA